MTYIKIVALVFGCSLMLCISAAQAQWQTSGSGMYYNSGDVGIGTKSPLSKLDIFKDNDALDYMLTLSKQYKNSVTNKIGLKFLLNRADDNRYASIVVGANSTWGRNTYFDFYTQPGGNDLPRVRMRIDGNGNVGIGTTNPTAKLAVNGTTQTKEVIVTDQSSEWPDYVFLDGYQLPDLRSLEQFVKANKHLPGIPTQQVVEREGQKLGVIQTKLLQKVEELTLHTITQQKILKELRENNKKLRENDEEQKVLIEQLQKAIENLKSGKYQNE